MPGSRVKNNCLGGTSRTLIARWRHDGSAKRRTCTLDTAPSGSAHPKHASQMEVPSPDDQDEELVEARTQQKKHLLWRRTHEGGRTAAQHPRRRPASRSDCRGCWRC